MKNYVLVIKENNNVRIGRHEYTIDEAEQRLLELNKAGITNMEIMHINEAFGVNKNIKKQLT